ncbi:hypothetical protein ACFYTC_14800 [Actinomadura nitritigenes]|uniref:hypothetical protein n=1 Tax=Actinomadura nitritigenes TaxID=134602 RepID=UPI00367D0E39
MHQVMDLLLIRFAIVVGGITLLIIAGFTGAIALKRRGRLGQARRLLEPAVRAWADRPAGRSPGRTPGGRYAGPGASGGTRGGGPSGLGRLAVRGALHYLDRAETRRTEGTDDRRDR